MKPHNIMAYALQLPNPVPRTISVEITNEKYNLPDKLKLRNLIVDLEQAVLDIRQKVINIEIVISTLKRELP